MTGDDLIDVQDIEAAAKRLQGVSIVTPLLNSPALDAECGGRVFLKPECLQVTGSFKIRGAYNRLSQLKPEQAAKGVVAWSSGNHAQGVAAAGRMLGIQTTIVMPKDAPWAKMQNTKRLGGHVVTYDRYTEDREAIARDIASRQGSALVPSYDHVDVIAGQGTVGLEIAEQLAADNAVVDQVLVPCGGGGLSSGIATALHERMPNSNVIAVEPSDFDDTERSFRAGSRLTIDPQARSICDALQSPSPGEITFAINRHLLHDVITVTDDEVRAALRFAFRVLKLVLEPGGAVALAAILHRKVTAANRTSLCVLSGGNIDESTFAEIQAEPN